MGRPGMLSSEPWSEYQGSNTRMLLRSRSSNLLSTLPKGIGLCLFTPSQAGELKLALTKCRGGREPRRDAWEGGTQVPGKNTAPLLSQGKTVQSAIKAAEA